MALGEVVKIVVSGDSEGAKKALRSAKAEASDTGKSFATMAKVAAGGFVALAAGAVEFGKSAVEAASKEESAHAQLVTALKNTKQSWGEEKDAIEGADKAGEHFGYTSAETESVLAQLETSTGSTKKAIELLGIAQDIAAAKGVSLADAAMAITKASQGQLRPLKQLGIDLPIAAGGALKTKTAMVALEKAQDKAKATLQAMHAGLLKGPAALRAYQSSSNALTAAQQKFNDVQSAGKDITGQVADLLHGRASAAADTFQGKTKELKARWEDFEANVGKKLIPVLEGLMAWITKDGIPILERFGNGMTRIFDDAYTAVVRFQSGLDRIRGDISSVIDTIEKIPGASFVLGGGASGPANAPDLGGLYSGKNPLKPSSGLGFDPTKSTAHTTIINNYPQGAAPAAVNAAKARSDRRNGRT